MKQLLKQNVLVLIAITLPLAFILLVALYVSISSKTVSSDYSFLYIECSDTINTYSCSNYLNQRYKIVNNKLTINQISADIIKSYEWETTYLSAKDTFYIYDAKNDKKAEITFNEATNLNLSQSKTSPDKVTIIENQSNNYSYSPFGSSRSRKDYLKKNGFSKQITLTESTDRYYNNYKFMGWILN